MKKLLLLFSVFLLTACANDPYKIDPVATAKAPWKVGEIVLEEKIGIIGVEESNESNPSIRPIRKKRVFQGITIDGYFIVQEFYEDGSPNGCAYLIVDADSVTDINPIMHGSIIYQYPTTQEKRMTCELEQGKGSCALWYRSGNIRERFNLKQTNIRPIPPEVFFQHSYPIDGVLTALDDRDIVLGELYGIHTTWFKNGVKGSEGYLLNGKMHGSAIEWYENGQKALEGLYQKNSRVGIWRSWDEDGNLISEVDYGDPDQVEGK